MGCRITETLHADEGGAPRAVGSPRVGPTLMASRHFDGFLTYFKFALRMRFIW